MSGPGAAPRVRLQALFIVLLVGLVVLVPPARHAIGRGLALLATGQLAQFQQHLLSLGPWAPVVSIGLMVAEALLIPVPVTIVMVANGLVFGTWLGALVSLAGGLLGALAAYFIGRSFGRPLVERLLPASSFAAAERLMTKYGGWAIVLERWIPGVPGDPMSYAAGITRMPLVRFFLLSMVGLVPANIVAAYVGVEIAGDVPLIYWLGGWALAAALWFGWRQFRSLRTP